MLGARERFDAVPFFWSQQHDLQLNYVGHAAHWDRVEIAGSLAAKDCTVTYRQSGRKLAVLTIGRDCDSLAAEIAWASGRPPSASDRSSAASRSAPRPVRAIR
jgi:Reductase C-terminal